MRGRPKITCTATAKSTGTRCGRAPIPGGTVCMFHGGATKKARAAGRRRLQQQAAHKALEVWEKKKAIHEAAMAPWIDEPSFRAPMEAWADPRDLRRIAREMDEGARLARAAARELEAEAPAGL